MRRRKQALTPEDCAQLLREEKRGALAVTGDMGYPYAIPLNFYYDEDEKRAAVVDQQRDNLLCP